MIVVINVKMCDSRERSRTGFGTRGGYTCRLAWPFCSIFIRHSLQFSRIRFSQPKCLTSPPLSLILRCTPSSSSVRLFKIHQIVSQKHHFVLGGEKRYSNPRIILSLWLWPSPVSCHVVSSFFLHSKLPSCSDRHTILSFVVHIPLLTFLFEVFSIVFRSSCILPSCCGILFCSSLPRASYLHH